MSIDLHETLRGAWDDRTRPRALFLRHVAKAPAAHAPAIVEGLASSEARVRNGCAELASLLAEAEPALLYPHVDLFLANLDAREPMLRWEAACTLGSLARVDRARRVAGAVDRLAALLLEDSIVLQGHAVRALAKVARVSPDAAPRILDALVRAKRRFPGSRVGYLVEAMEAFAGRADLAAKARRFAAAHVAASPAVAAKAKRALRRLS